MSETLYDFAVIGAGMAGASIAAELAPHAKVLVLEGSGRIGGRAYTADHVYGRPEFGASQIGPYYARIRDRCRQLEPESGQSGRRSPFAHGLQNG